MSPVPPSFDIDPNSVILVGISLFLYFYLFFCVLFCFGKITNRFFVWNKYWFDKIEPLDFWFKSTFNNCQPPLAFFFWTFFLFYNLGSTSKTTSTIHVGSISTNVSSFDSVVFKTLHNNVPQVFISLIFKN